MEKKRRGKKEKKRKQKPHSHTDSPLSTPNSKISNLKSQLPILNYTQLPRKSFARRLLQIVNNYLHYERAGSPKKRKSALL